MAYLTGKRGSYRIQWRTGGRGSKIESSPTFADKGDALAFQRDIETKLAHTKRATATALSSTPLPELLKRWAASRIAAGRARSDYLIEAAATITAVADAMKWKRVGDITTESLDRWRSSKTAGTDRPLACIKAFSRWCRQTLKLPVDEEVWTIEPQRRRKRTQPPLLTDPQVADILTTAHRLAGSSVATALEHLALYGCRPVDACRLLVSDWSGPAKVITYRNTKNGDDISHLCHPGHAAKLDALCAGRPGTGPLFLDPWNRPWRLRAGKAEGMASWYYANIGEHLLPDGQRGVYCLKDYALSRLAVAAQGDRRAVVAISGHRSLGVVDRYLATNSQVQARLVLAVSEPPPVSAQVSAPTPALPAIEGAPSGRRKRAPKPTINPGGEAGAFVHADSAKAR